jgi:hypothetical protein
VQSAQQRRMSCTSSANSAAHPDRGRILYSIPGAYVCA